MKMEGGRQRAFLPGLSAADAPGAARGEALRPGGRPRYREKSREIEAFRP